MVEHSGITCTECYVDIGNNLDHMCGWDPIVRLNERSVIFDTYINTHRCKYCWSHVGKQHYMKWCKSFSVKMRWIKNFLLRKIT